MDASVWDVLALSTSIKLLLFPAYRSTDFEVHRNWLAVTHSLPISQWYFDTTSEWTLDYPPFFAYFEKLLSIPASLIDSGIVGLQNLNYDSFSVVTYQRTTVILSELVLAAVLLRFVNGSIDLSVQRILSVSLFLHPGFLIVDHIHFQYNGFMFGIMLWSLLMARNGNKLACGILFAVLLNFKHIYMYIAPAYFVYLLRSYCISPNWRFLPANFIKLGGSVIAIFLLSFGPFIVMGQIPQVLSRLFPFTRGLNHAYWAPNFWALVTFADRLLLKAVDILHLPLTINQAGVASSSRGLVGDTVFAILPNIKPHHTFLLTIASQLVWLVKLWINPSYKSFVTAVALCGYSSFLFGWHVHEKAILLVLVPLSLLAAERQAYFRTFILASMAGIYSLFPLLFTPAESFIKVVYSVIWLGAIYFALSKRVYEFPNSFAYIVLDIFEKIYMAGFPLLLLISWYLHFTSSSSASSSTVVPCSGFDSGSGVDQMDDCQESMDESSAQLDFLPLMMTSVYCSVGVIWAYIRLGFIYLYEESTYQGQMSIIQ